MNPFKGRVSLFLQLICAFFVAIGIAITWEVVWTARGYSKDAVKFFALFSTLGTFAVIALVAFLVSKIRDLVGDYQSKKIQEFRATGADDFVFKTMSLKSIFEALEPDITEAERSFRCEAISKEKETERDVRGVVCGEEVVAVAQGNEIFITASTPKAIKAIRKAIKRCGKMETRIHLIEAL
jgi:hypothetical protein